MQSITHFMVLGAGANLIKGELQWKTSCLYDVSQQQDYKDVSCASIPTKRICHISIMELNLKMPLAPAKLPS